MKLFSHITVISALIALFSIGLGLSGCGLRTEYPEIHFYKLNSYPESKIKESAVFDASLLIRDVMVSTGDETDQIMTTNEDGSIKKYYYHRWVSDIPSLISDFFRERYTKFGLFKGGISKSASAIIPDYILEITVLDFKSQNTSKGAPYVEVTVSATVLAHPRGDAKPIEKLFTKSFSAREFRHSSEANAIAPAFSKALNVIADDIYLALYNFVTKNVD